MRLEILSARVELRPEGHNVKPDILFVDNLDLSFNNELCCNFNFERQIRYISDIEDGYVAGWMMTGGAKMWEVNNVDTGDDFYEFNNFSDVPKITSINEISYEAYNEDKHDRVDYDFKLNSLSLSLIDHSTGQCYEVEASEETIDMYNFGVENMYKVVPYDVYVNSIDDDYVDVRLSTKNILYKTDVQMIGDPEQLVVSDLILELKDSDDINDLSILFPNWEWDEVDYISLDDVELINVKISKDEFRNECKRLFANALIKEARKQ